MTAPRELTIADYVAILRRRWWILLVTVIVGGAIGYGLTRILPKRYTSRTLVLVEPPTVPRNYVQPVVSENLNERLASMQEQILSRTRLQPIVDQFGLYREDRNRVPMQELVDRLAKSISVQPVKPMPETQSGQLPGFYVSVTLDNPRTAQQVCYQVTSMFMEQNLQLRQQQAQDTTNFLDRQLADAKTTLDQQDAKLAAFQREHLGELPDDQKTNLSLLTSLTSQLDAVNQAMDRAQQDKSFDETLLAQQMQAWKASQAGQNPLTLQQQLNALQQQLVSLKARYTDDYPDVIKMKSDIAALQAKIKEANAQKKSTAAESKPPNAEEVPPQIEQLKAQIHEYDVEIEQFSSMQKKLQQQIKSIQARLQLSPLVQAEFNALTRDHGTALKFYDDLLAKRNDSAMATDLERRQESEQFSVLDPANLPEKPSFPDPVKFTTSGVGGGFALGLALIALVEARRRTIRTERDVEDFLGLATLALIPEIKLSKAEMHINGNGHGNGRGRAPTLGTLTAGTAEKPGSAPHV